MSCGLEIPLAILGAVAAVAAAITAVSEALPFIKKTSANGLVHMAYHFLNKDKCVPDEITEVVETIIDTATKDVDENEVSL